MSNKFCRFCYKELIDGCKFCPECGKPVADPFGEALRDPDVFSPEEPERTDRDIEAREAGADYYPAREPIREVRDDDIPRENVPLSDGPSQDLPKKSAKKKRKLPYVLIIVGLLLLGACVFLLCNDIVIEPVKKEAVKKKPESTAEIVAFYDKAVDLVKTKGQAAYSKKEWQNMSEVDITGIGLVDEILSIVVEKYIVSESSAKKLQYEALSEEGMAAFPDFTLPDSSGVISAELSEMNGNYLINMSFAPETDPKKGGVLSSITKDVIYRDSVVVPILDAIPGIRSYSDLRVEYTDFTITCEITPDGRFLSLKHTGKADIVIGELRMHLVPINNIKVNVETNALYQDFEYEKNDRD